MDLSLLLSAALAAGAAAAPPPLPEQAFVVADVLRVRAEPSADAPVVARLRIGTKVSLLERREAWARIAVLGGGWDGWALGSLLAPKALTASEARNRAASTRGDERISWLERWAAIEPANQGVWKNLADALDAAGEKERATSARTALDVRRPGFVAHCLSSTAYLASEWVPGQPTRSLVLLYDQMDDFPPEAGLEGLEVPPGCQKLRREQERLVQQLPSVPWYRFDGTQVPGSPFPQPGLMTPDMGHGPFALGVFLGDCEVQNPARNPRSLPWAVTTTPLIPAKTTSRALPPPRSSALAALGEVKILRSSAWTIAGTPELTEVRFEGETRIVAEAHDAEAGTPVTARMHVVGWALFGAAPDPILFRMLVRDDPARKRSEKDEWTFAEIGPSAWSRLALRPSVRVAAIPWFTSSGSGGAFTYGGEVSRGGGVWIVTVDEEGRARFDTDEETVPCRTGSM